jgi:acetyl-CoA acetyltransferase
MATALPVSAPCKSNYSNKQRAADAHACHFRYTLGLSGVPIYNVNNNCSTGSSALFLSHQLVAGGGADCLLAVGFEKM